MTFVLTGVNRLTQKLILMKPSITTAALLLVLMSLTLTSCELAAGIFKAGMGVGIFIVVAIIVGVIALIAKVGRR